MKKTLKVRALGVDVTWTRKGGYVLDPVARSTYIVSATVDHPCKDGERAQLLSVPALGISNLPTSRAARAAIDRWERAVCEEAGAITAEDRAAIDTGAQRNRRGCGVRGFIVASVR